MSEDTIKAIIVKAYDSMSRQRWEAFQAYCRANQKLTIPGLLSFTEYLVSLPDPPSPEGRTGGSHA